jgi:hypothetical protein
MRGRHLHLFDDSAETLKLASEYFQEPCEVMPVDPLWEVCHSTPAQSFRIHLWDFPFLYEDDYGKTFSHLGLKNLVVPEESELPGDRATTSGSELQRGPGAGTSGQQAGGSRGSQGPPSGARTSGQQAGGSRGSQGPPSVAVPSGQQAGGSRGSQSLPKGAFSSSSSDSDSSTTTSDDEQDQAGKEAVQPGTKTVTGELASDHGAEWGGGNDNDSPVAEPRSPGKARAAVQGDQQESPFTVTGDLADALEAEVFDGGSGGSRRSAYRALQLPTATAAVDVVPAGKPDVPGPSSSGPASSGRASGGLGRGKSLKLAKKQASADLDEAARGASDSEGTADDAGGAEKRPKVDQFTIPRRGGLHTHRGVYHAPSPAAPQPSAAQAAEASEARMTSAAQAAEARMTPRQKANAAEAAKKAAEATKEADKKAVGKRPAEEENVGPAVKNRRKFGR